MVDEERVEGAPEGARTGRPAFVTDCEIRLIDGVASFEHTDLGLVTVRFEAFSNLDSPESIKKWEGDFRAFITNCYEYFKDAKETA